MGATFSAKGFVTLDDLDALSAKIDALSDTIKKGDLLAYSNATKYNVAADMLPLEKTGFVARRIPLTFSGTDVIEGVLFGQDFTEAPIVVCNAISDKNPYLAFPENVTTSSCTIRLIPINTMQNKKAAKKIDAKGVGDYIDLIAVGKTKN